MKKFESREMDHYRLYLLGHLRDHRFPQFEDSKYIEQRTEAAYDTYVANALEGKSVSVAHELAMRTLLEGTFISRWDVIMQVIEEDLWLRIPEDSREQWAELFLGLRFINSILDEYEVNGDFLERGSYPSLKTALLGEMTEILDGYGL